MSPPLEANVVLQQGACPGSRSEVRVERKPPEREGHESPSLYSVEADLSMTRPFITSRRTGF